MGEPAALTAGSLEPCPGPPCLSRHPPTPLGACPVVLCSRLCPKQPHGDRGGQSRGSLHTVARSKTCVSCNLTRFSEPEVPSEGILENWAPTMFTQWLLWGPVPVHRGNKTDPEPLMELPACQQ